MGYARKSQDQHLAFCRTLDKYIGYCLAVLPTRGLLLQLFERRRKNAAAWLLSANVVLFLSLEVCLMQQNPNFFSSFRVPASSAIGQHR